MLTVPVLSTLAAAEQIQYFDPTWKYGLALTSTIGENGTEVIIQLSAPTSYGWAAVGTGSHMDGSVMFFIYPSNSKDKVTLSVRQAKDHTPMPTTQYRTSLVKSSIRNGTMSATISWKSANRTFGGKLDITQHKQPLIWALGPNQQIQSSDVNLNLLQHADASHGVLFADMPFSQNPSSVLPDLNGSTKDVNMKVQPAIYGNLVVIHAVMLCAAFLVFFPLGVVGLRWRWAHGFQWHWIIQVVGIIAALGGLGVAVTQSIMGIVHSSFDEPHQIIGIALCLLLPLQAFFGRAQHLRNKIYKKWTWASWTHVLGGRLLIYGAGVNVALSVSQTLSIAAC